MSYIKIFTFLSEKEVDQKIKEHKKAPHLRLLQKTIAHEVTILVHGSEELVKAQEASQILFGNTTSEALQNLTPDTFLELFEGVPQAEIKLSLIKDELWLFPIALSIGLIASLIPIIQAYRINIPKTLSNV